MPTSYVIRRDDGQYFAGLSVVRRAEWKAWAEGAHFFSTKLDAALFCIKHVDDLPHLSTIEIVEVAVEE